MMRAFFAMGVVGAAALVVLATPGWAGGRGGGVAVVRAGAGPHGGGWRALGRGAGQGGARSLPPVSGVIHERVGTRPYYSAYGHTATAPTGALRAWRVGVSSAGWQGGGAGFGHTATSIASLGYLRPGVYRVGRSPAAWGGRNARLRYGAVRRGFLAGYGRRFPFGGYGGYPGYAGYGGYSSYGGYSGYGAGGVDGGSGSYGQGGTYGGPNIGDGEGVYGSGSVGDGPSIDQTGAGVDYLSETPLAARFAEPPLAPSPYAPAGFGDRFADAPDGFGSGVGPRIIRVSHARRSGCDCAPRSRQAPVVFRYGAGAAD